MPTSELEAGSRPALIEAYQQFKKDYKVLSFQDSTYRSKTIGYGERILYRRKVEHNGRRPVKEKKYETQEVVQGVHG